MVAWAKLHGVDENNAQSYFDQRLSRAIESLVQLEADDDDTPEFAEVLLELKKSYQESHTLASSKTLKTAE